MNRNFLSGYSRFEKAVLFALTFFAFAGFVLFLVTKFTITGHAQGIFLLKGRKGALLELKDDIYLGDGGRVLLALDFGRLKSKIWKAPEGKENTLRYEWDEKDGSGYVISYLPGGRELKTFFARFEDSDERPVHGLFVGGGLPDNVDEDEDVKEMNETGMTLRDGKDWYHLWCNVNEGIASGRTDTKYPPSYWEFLGSMVLKAGDQALAIRSDHKVVIDGVPLLILRNAYFRAGDTYFLLSMVVENVGEQPVSVYYCYGDEPWVGDFGTSAGNVGWVEGSLIKRVQWVDPNRYKYAGFFDYGNDLIGESHDQTYTANFIQWLGVNVPSVYFSNGPLDYPKEDGTDMPPLKGDERFLGLQWGPQTINPGQKERYVLAIGMALIDKNTGFPVKPEIDLSMVDDFFKANVLAGEK